MPYHLYADDTQLYLPIKKNDGSSLKRLLDCLKDIKDWMALSFLNFNENKTELIIFGPSGAREAPLRDLDPLLPYFKPTVLNLGVKVDSDFKLDQQINSVVKSSFYHLGLLSKIKLVLSFNDFERVIHAFISTRLDYCNALYVGVNQASLARLQLVQNAAARLLTGARKHEHITPILASLHWLPVHFRINFKILLFVFKSFQGSAPQYISDLLNIYTPPRSLRSADHFHLVVPKTRLKTRGDRAFSVVAPKLWNDLLLEIKTSPTLTTFKSRLKTHFYSLAFNSA